MALLTLPAVLSGQTVRWELQGIRTAFCIDFLIAPGSLSRTPFPAGRAVPAGQATELPGVLSRLVHGTDSLAGWYPASLCLLQADSSRVGSSVQRHRDRPVSVLLWRLAGGENLPAVAMATERRLLDAGDLSRSAEVTDFEATFDLDRQTSERVVTVTVDQSWFAWDGFTLPDTLAATSAEPSWTMVGPPPPWRGSLRFEGTTWHRVTGSLSIRGRGALASLLSESPVQWIDSYGVGGSATLSLER